MYLIDILKIMLVTGLLGGIVNYCSDANIVTETQVKKRPVLECLLLGIAATLIVPLFLKIADSKLIENIQIPAENLIKKTKADIHSYNVYNRIDSTGKTIKIDTIKNNNPTINQKEPIKQSEKLYAESAARDYLLWIAYCMLAAAAGMRFIDLLINKFLTQEYINKVEEAKNVAVHEKENLEGEIAKKDEKKIQHIIANERLEFETLPDEANIDGKIIPDMILPKLPPITNPDDPQKGRFGGRDHMNGRTLSVSYRDSNIPGFLDLIIRVTADHEENKLKGYLYLFLHDSFPKSLIKIEAEGKTEVSYDVVSYGAFTVGAIVDNGATYLECDIAELKHFPNDFRNR
ncbi:uncharacterized protein CHSO_0051 [Chryseobacterium sp. StRB126]|uniref:YEATS-associated helix-containing protein n=1 Tax=Chryseobacterium sp. StRB126 TaxID=878220 RepID=UPI0004E99BEB|nr:YEATS-associated helix-containing protein [Chryseobacterium sp. StRB126]BAP29088.1 uncharacterized protein CHSO_0051 [Chryseobacterium sp. StRB126]